ncbi:MAG: hypothetical protein ACOC1O_05905 [bacterium]
MKEWFSVREIVEKIYGEVENDDPRLKSAYGFIEDSYKKNRPEYISKDLRKREEVKVNNKGKPEYTYSLREESLIILENLLSIKSFLNCGRIKAYEILYKESKKPYVKKKFRLAKKELEELYTRLYHSVKSLDSIQNKILSDDFDPTKEILAPEVKEVSTIKLIDVIKQEVSNYKDELDKINYYIQLGALDLANELLDIFIEEKQQDYGRAYYLKAIIYMLKDADNKNNNEKDILKHLIKAYMNWPDISKNKKQKLIDIIIYKAFNEVNNNDNETIFSDHRLKDTLLEVIKEKQVNNISFETEVLILHLYFILYPDKYKDFASSWVRRIKEEKPINILLYIKKKDKFQEVINKHLDRNLSKNKREEIMEQINRKMIKQFSNKEGGDL